MNTCVSQTVEKRNFGVAERAAQERWAALPVARRLDFVRHLRQLIAEDPQALAGAASRATGRPGAEKLVSEVLPLVDACLAARAAGIWSCSIGASIGWPPTARRHAPDA